MASKTMTLDEILTNESGTDGVTSTMLKEIQAEEQKERLGRVRGVIKIAMSNSKDHLEVNVRHLRVIRKQEKAQAEKVAKLQKAVDFMNKTGNFFPVLKIVCDTYALTQHMDKLGLTRSDYPDDHAIWQVG